MESGHRTPTRLEQERNAALARQQQQAMQAELAAQAAAQQHHQPTMAAAQSDIELMRQAMSQEFSRMREELIGQVQEERAALAAELHRVRNDAYSRVDATSQVKHAPMPAFLGERDALVVASWCDAANDRILSQLREEYQLAGRTWDDDAELKCVRVAASFFHGAARLWWSVLEPKPIRFDRFIGVFKREFEPIASSQIARDRLAACVQRNRSVHEYANDFVQVLLKQPADYHEALRAALAIDAVYRQSVHASAFSNDGVAPMDLGTAEGPRRRYGRRNNKGKNVPKAQSKGNRRPLIGNHLGADTCRNCGRRGHWAADCTQELGVAEYEIGTSAVSGASDLIRLPVFVNGHKAQAIVDTGATATFISQALCRRLRVPYTKCGANGPRIRLADGRSEPIHGKASFLLVAPGATDESTNAWVHQGHHELILGLDWLHAHELKIQVAGKSIPGPAAAIEAPADEPEKPFECAVASGHKAHAPRANEEVPEDEHGVLHMPAKASCDACQAAKLKVLRAPRKKENSQFEGFNDVVSVDLVDPTETGICGTRWLMTHRDAATAWLVVAPLANKTSESTLMALIEIQRGRGWPRLVKTDDGGEFQGAFETALKGNLVAHEVGLPHRPNTHAIHERMHRDLNAGVRALLAAAGLDSPWFAFAAQYWAAARNVKWEGADGKTPYEARYGFAWNRELPPFGRGVYVLAPERTKYDPPGTLALVIGIRMPTPTTTRTPLNLLVAPYADLRSTTARWVGEWSLSANEFPKKERPSEEGVMARVMPERDSMHESEGNRSSGHTQSSLPGDKSAEAQQEDNEVVLVSPPQRKKERRVWSADMNNALSAGYEKHGPNWSLIGESGGESLRGIGSKGLRSHAAAMGLLGERAMGLKEHRRGIKTGNTRAMQMVLGVAQLAQQETTEEGLGAQHGRTASCSGEVVELGVAEIVPFADHAHTKPGRIAFQKEMQTLIGSGALPFHKVVSKHEAARAKQARFVNMKPIMAIKNSEMPPEHRVLKCRVVAQGCHITDATGRRAPPEVPQFDRPPGLSSIRAAVSVALHTHGEAADAMFFDIDAAYVHAPLLGSPTFAYFKSLMPFLDSVLPRADMRKISSIPNPVVPIPMALYGLPRAGFDYSAYAREKLCAAHWKESASDKNIYWRRRNGALTLLVLYVDDGAILGTTHSVSEAMRELVRMFNITKSAQLISESTRAKPIRYLGVNVYREEGAWIFDSCEFARYITAAHKGGRARATPLSSRVKTSEEANSCSSEVRSCLGKLMWLARTTRPDVAHAVAMIARHTDRWSADAERALSEVLAYLYKHADVRLRYPVPQAENAQIMIHSYVDSDLDPGRSTSGTALFLVSGDTRHLVEWSSRRQRRVATSTAEAELVALHGAVQNALFPIALFLEDVGRGWPRATIRCDNETALGAVMKGFSPGLLHASKTQKICLAWLHELYREALVTFDHVPTRGNMADPLTKPVSADVFRGHARAWGLSSSLLSPSATESC
ncbi:Copia protein [Porphyridium purpureum]|uniref:Copia protein n=1 Tax=Porphyridium purpureum TaxID=35688 RepID=A0A5J4YVP3_PORPP|nr:Copia protein [Porphyridium purpureum]|eukprot:POR2805..scf227_4